MCLRTLSTCSSYWVRENYEATDKCIKLLKVSSLHLFSMICFNDAWWLVNAVWGLTLKLIIFTLEPFWSWKQRECVLYMRPWVGIISAEVVWSSVIYILSSPFCFLQSTTGEAQGLQDCISDRARPPAQRRPLSQSCQRGKELCSSYCGESTVSIMTHATSWALVNAVLYWNIQIIYSAHWIVLNK